MKCQWELKDILCFAAVRAEVSPKNHSREENHKQSIFVHDLKIYQIYKGQEKFPDITINITADNGSFVKAYSVNVGLRSSTEYFLAGSIKKGEILLNQRSWIQPWKEVTSEQRKGIERFYGRNCECHITPACFGATDCFQPLKGCQVSHDYHTMQQFYQGCEWRYSCCMKNREATACSWQETAEYRNCRDKVLPWNWQQTKKLKIKKKNNDVGNWGTIKGFSLKKYKYYLTYGRLESIWLFFHLQRMLIICSFADVSCEQIINENADINSKHTSSFLAQHTKCLTTE